MKPVLWPGCVLALSILAAQGCSFRLPAPQAGRILKVQQKSGGGVGMPVRLWAEASFTGAVDSPTLAILSMPDQGPLQVAAYGTPAQAFMGLGIFPADRKGEHRVTVEATVVLTKPGRFTVEALYGSAGEVTATAALEVR